MNKMILKAQAVLANKTAEMYVDKVVWVLAVIIVGMALMWGIYTLFNGTVMNGLANSITNLFTNTDKAIGTHPVVNPAAAYTETTSP